MSRSIRSFALACAGTALLAVVPASAAALTSTYPTSLDFGSQTVGTPSAGKDVSLIVDCDAILVPPVCVVPVFFTPAISASGDFTQTTTCPPTIAAVIEATSGCPITVTFNPTAAGARTGSLLTGGPVVPLTGTGVAQSAPTTPGAGGTTGTKKKCKKKSKKRSASSAKKKKCKKKKKKRR